MLALCHYHLHCTALNQCCMDLVQKGQKVPWVCHTVTNSVSIYNAQAKEK